MEEKKGKKRIVFPDGLTKEEKSKLTAAMKDLEKVPRIERKETLKLSLSSNLQPDERKKIVEEIVKPIKSSTAKIEYKDYIIEETSVEEYEEAIVIVEE